MPPRPLLDLSRIDPSRVVADIEGIRALNPQRHEFEMLSWICHNWISPDRTQGEQAGVYEVPAHPFWARGHIPGRPLMPGVLLVESAAQLASYAIHQVYDPADYGGRLFGFAAVDGVKFRGQVLPGERLLVLGKSVEIRPRRGIFDTQIFVRDEMVFEGRITGMWI
jgi:3-hydroxyacyl-[acyl-carrier-protein] dehydratase